MKRQFLISLFVLVFVSGFAAAMDLQWSEFSDPQHNASASYKQNELIVRFSDPDAGTQLPEWPVLMDPLAPALPEAECLHPDRQSARSIRFVYKASKHCALDWGLRTIEDPLPPQNQIKKTKRIS